MASCQPALASMNTMSLIWTSLLNNFSHSYISIVYISFIGMLRSKPSNTHRWNLGPYPSCLKLLKSFAAFRTVALARIEYPLDASASPPRVPRRRLVKITSSDCSLTLDIRFDSSDPCRRSSPNSQLNATL